MKDLKDLIAPYTIAKSLQEKDFDEKCFAHYHKTELVMMPVYDGSVFNTLAPLYQQVVNWLNEKHGLHITSGPTASYTWKWMIYDYKTFEHRALFQETLDEAIIEAIKLIE